MEGEIDFLLLVKKNSPVFSERPVLIISEDSTIKGNKDGIKISEQNFNPVMTPLAEACGMIIIIEHKNAINENNIRFLIGFM